MKICELAEPRHESGTGRLGEACRTDPVIAGSFFDPQEILAPQEPEGFEEELCQGVKLMCEGRPDAAEKIFLGIIARRPDQTTALNNLGLVAFQTGRQPEARQYFQRALRADPLYKDGLLNYSTMLRRMGKHQEALPFLNAYLKAHPDDPEVLQARSGRLRRQPGPAAGPGEAPAVASESASRLAPSVEDLNRQAGQCLREGDLEQAKDLLVSSLARQDEQPQAREELLKTLYRILNANSEESRRQLLQRGKPKYFDREERRNPYRHYFLKYVPEEMVAEKSGLNILFVSDVEVAGNQTRMMNIINDHTIHKARNIILHRDYLNYGEDLVMDNPADQEEARELIARADLFHFVRQIPFIEGVEWTDRLNQNNCFIDYFGGDIKGNKPQVVNFHQRSGLFGLNKYDYAMYKDAEFMMYHVPTMFDATEYKDYPLDFSFYERDEVVISHQPTNPQEKYTHYILPMIERVRSRVPQRIRVILTMGKPNRVALEEKAQSHIHIDAIRPQGLPWSGNPGMTTHESLAMGKVTICTLDNFYLSLYPDAPVFSATCEGFEDLLVDILTKPEMVKEKMGNAKEWLKQFHPIEVMKKYLQIYQLILRGNSFVNSSDPFFRVWR